jgi:hypothetical protein
MTASQLIRQTLAVADGGFDRILADMGDAPLTRPTSAGGNHPLWIVGHLAIMEGMLPGIILGPEGGENPVADWQSLFGTGTTPVADASKYPPFEQVVARYRELRARSRRLLEGLDDARMDDKPKAVPPGFEEVMTTVASTFMLVALHTMVHYGQIADARRVAGRPPLI